MNQADAKRAVDEARVARLATVNHLGAVDVVPITYAMSRDMLVTTIDDKPKTTTEVKRLDNIRNHPEVTLIVDHYEEEWRNLWWVRLRGRAKVLNNGSRFESVLDDLAAKYPQYQDRRPKGPVIEIDITGWSWWSAKDA